MSERKLKYILFEFSEQIFDVITPEDHVKDMCQSHPLTINLINALAESEYVVDAIRFLAAAMNKRQAIWWTRVVNERLISEDNRENLIENMAWSHVEQWVYNPTEENRIRAYEIAENLDFRTAGSYAALAVFWSGGNILPKQTQEFLLPPPQLCCSAVGASILLTCAREHSYDIIGRQRESVKIGLDIAGGKTGLQSGGIENNDKT